MADRVKDTSGLRNVLAEAAAGTIGRYSLAIVWEAPKVASGVWVEYKGDHFIATARHVAIDLSSDHVFVIPRTESPLVLGEKADIPQRLQRGVRAQERQRVEISDRYLSDADTDQDVALLRVRTFHETIRWVEFFPLERAASDVSVGTPVIVYGHPWDLGVLVDPGKGRGIGFPRIVYGSVDACTLSRYDAARNLFITYEESDPTMTARGMSGGGVWLLPPFEQQEIWDPNRLILVGIQVAWFPEVGGRPLLATRVEHVRALVE